MSVKSGSHLGVVHRWIQRKFCNGDRVTWGSETDVLRANLTPASLERLAQDISDSVFKDIKKRIKVCANFEADYNADRVGVCIHCGHLDKLHEDQYGL